MTSEQLAKKAIKTGTDARGWASPAVQIELALARCAAHLHYSDDEHLAAAAVTTKKAIDKVVAYFSEQV